MTTIQMRRGTAAQWSVANPVLASGEFGFEVDTGKSKFGDGVTTWNVLSYRVTTGPKGDPGSSVTIIGTVATAANLPTGLVAGDAGKGWLTNNDGHLHVWSGSSWTDVGLIRGPDGPQGPMGPLGPTGPQGPTGSQGIQGIQGPTGPTGGLGATGPTGSGGLGLPAGGSAGQILVKSSGTDYATQWVATDPVMIRVKNPSDITGFGSGAYTGQVWSQDYVRGPSGMFSLSGGLVTVVNAGVYILTLNVTCSAGTSTGTVRLQNTDSSIIYTRATWSSTNAIASCVASVYLSAGATVKASIRNDASTITINADTATTPCGFSVTRMPEQALILPTNLDGGAP